MKSMILSADRRSGQQFLKLHIMALIDPLARFLMF